MDVEKIFGNIEDIYHFTYRLSSDLSQLVDTQADGFKLKEVRRCPQ